MDALHGPNLKWSKHQKGETATGRRGVRAQLSEIMPRVTMLYLQLCSSRQQRHKDVNALCKERKFPLCSHETEAGWRMQIQGGSDIPAARPTIQPRQTMCYPGAYSSYIAEDSAGDAAAHVEAVP